MTTFIISAGELPDPDPDPAERAVDDPQLTLFDASQYPVRAHNYLVPVAAEELELSARRPSSPDIDDQMTLFDADEYLVQTPDDPTPGLSRTDLLAFALDPEPTVRVEAATSSWNCDVRLQRALATDPEERVVLALLEHTDPSYDVCELIIDGPHIVARRALADPRRNLCSGLLERLAGDADAAARSMAAAELSRRTMQSASAGHPRCTVCSSWDVQRHVEGYRVWFSCNRCGAVFGQ